MSDEKCIDDMVRELVNGGIDADGDGQREALEFVMFVLGLAKAAAHVAADLKDRGKFDELATAIESLWDEYVATHDFKFLPDAYEPLIKSLARGQIRSVLALVYDQLDKAA